MALYSEPQSVFEAAAKHRSINVTCGSCGHVTIFDPHELWWHFEQRGWDDRLKIVGRRFRCRGCSKKAAKVVLGAEAPSDHRPKMQLPEERVWKRAINRYRG